MGANERTVTEAPRAGFLQRYQSVRDRTRQLCHGLSREDCALQSMPDASPVKWHLAHTTWFFETFVLAPRMPGYTERDASYRYLFNSYYEGIGPQFPRPQRGLISRPSLDEVWGYRAHVDAAMRRWLEAQPAGPEPADAALLELGLAHEEQHQELILSDLKSLLALNPLRPVYRAVPVPVPAAGVPRGAAEASRAAADASHVDADEPHAAARSRWSRFEGGVVTVGRPATASAGGGFRFDNETPRHRVFVEPFELADAPVTNGDYLRFIADGGYSRPNLWLSEGIQAVRAQQWQAPQYWTRQGDGGWSVFTLHGELALDPDAPVCHLSLYEADAYARWAGARLPTEFEWERAAADVLPVGQFADDDWLQPRAPVPGRLAGLYGGAWEWTSSAYGPYPGFFARDDAIGEYNGKFMVNQYVLRGGSCATPPGHVRATYRNFFPAAARWQFAGLRLARSV
jgi:ergothioneine biosynthesis protein EgtB